MSIVVAVVVIVIDVCFVVAVVVASWLLDQYLCALHYYKNVTHTHTHYTHTHTHLRASLELVYLNLCLYAVYSLSSTATVSL